MVGQGSGVASDRHGHTRSWVELMMTQKGREPDSLGCVYIGRIPIHENSAMIVVSRNENEGSSVLLQFTTRGDHQR